ncbi:MAG: CopG family transcriptional regulator [Candidatus Latescibacteria bacterium]|nr:CopG family transcriptional regulator [Candidatus Latescibacterota bacterium]
MKAKVLEEKFDRGEDITGYLGLDRARRPAQEPKRVNVDFPIWMVHSLDREAGRLGVTRQSIIKFWIAEKLKVVSSRNAGMENGDVPQNRRV